MLSSSATVIRSTGTASWAASAARYAVPGRRGDDDVDVGKSERGLLEAAAGDLGAGGGELLVHRGRPAESKHIARVFESDSGAEVLTVVGDVHPVHTAESEVVVAPVAQQCRPDGGERKVLSSSRAPGWRHSRRPGRS